MKNFRVHGKIRILGGIQEKPIGKKEGIAVFEWGVDTPMHSMYPGVQISNSLISVQLRCKTSSDHQKTNFTL